MFLKKASIAILFSQIFVLRTPGQAVLGNAKFNEMIGTLSAWKLLSGIVLCCLESYGFSLPGRTEPLPAFYFGVVGGDKFISANSLYPFRNNVIHSLKSQVVVRLVQRSFGD